MSMTIANTNKTAKTVRVTISMPASLSKWLSLEAAKANLSVSEYIKNLIRDRQRAQ